ncbi:MAG: AAA family ATPase [Gallionella sp.]|jgi:predicted ATPase|nr:AAA family ATPase [Gallionella sp.]
MNLTQIPPSPPLIFNVIPNGAALPKNVRFQAFLNRDPWDDWGKYCTQFYLTVVDDDGVAHSIGDVKIGQFDLKPHKADIKIPKGHRKPALPDEFESLEPPFFALGQTEEYYEKLAELGDGIREIVLKNLRDVAFDADLWTKAKDEYVMRESLLRSITNTTVERQFWRMAHGGARLTNYRFSYDPPKRLGDGKSPYTLVFNVKHESMPPTNVHVLIGRNGVGKTHLLSLMTKALIAPSAAARQSGSFSWDNPDGLANHFFNTSKSSNESNFANLVIVSYSAFDETKFPSEDTTPEGKLKYFYVGLHRASQSDKVVSSPMNLPALSKEFVRSLANCQIAARRRRWLAALDVLMNDPVFKSASLDQLISFDLKDEEQKAEALKIFKNLSSGHKIVLLTLTRLVETVEEKTLVLVDEIEAHLHPPLLSAFIRALSNLLIDRNGVAIIATHSPVVLQEVPKTCVWILNRSLREAKAERPTIETFGENVGVLSREVFQLELSQSGYQQMLEEAAQKSVNYEDAVDSFHGHLGAEARAVLQALFLEREPKES